MANIFLDRARFSFLAEIEPATRPDLQPVREQIAVLAPVADAFLIPDNHLGRATVSSLAVAHEVQKIGGRSIACLNARDRNLLGFRRDLLTAQAYAVSHLLLVRGDRPQPGQLNVKVMLEAAREWAPELKVGVVARAGAALPAWKMRADFLITQVGFAPDEFVAWRRSIDFTGPVLAGVIVFASAAMARRLKEGGYGIDPPAELIETLERNPSDGPRLALDLVSALATSAACDGVHLIAGNRYREVAMRLLLARGL